MTVAELIAKLQEMPQDKEVYFQGERDAVEIDDVATREMECQTMDWEAKKLTFTEFVAVVLT